MLWVSLLLFWMLGIGEGKAQSAVSDSLPAVVVNDSVVAVVRDSIKAVAGDSIVAALDSMYNAMEKDSSDIVAIKAMTRPEQELKPAKTPKPKRDWTTWRPDPKRAMWLALVIPGGGQIYNRKYWKLPIFYGGFIGCIYALNWNSMMYKDYQQAYLDIMDSDPNTNSFNKFLHLGRQITNTNMDYYKQVFKNRKDKYRRWRDMSFFVMVGIYAISVIDAYVDAELSDFDISKDLSMKIRPTVIGSGTTRNPLYATSFGVNCSLNF